MSQRVCLFVAVAIVGLPVGRGRLRAEDRSPMLRRRDRNSAFAAEPPVFDRSAAPKENRPGRPTQAVFRQSPDFGGQSMPLQRPPANGWGHTPPRDDALDAKRVEFAPTTSFAEVFAAAEPFGRSSPPFVQTADWSCTGPLEGDDTVNPFDRPPDPGTFWHRVHSDHALFYSPDNLIVLLGGFGVGAWLANTDMDHNVHRHFQLSVRSASSDDWFESLHAQKELGNGRYTIPVFAAAWAAGRVFEDRPAAGVVGEWGERSLRTILVGAPPLLISQRLIGGSRPYETSSRSSWTPFHDNNGVSGHSFMGAVPFLAAAKMADNPWLKAAFYAGSALAPVSRVNDSAHYPSQVLLGWWMAYVASSVVDTTNHAEENWQLLPLTDGNVTGFAVDYRW